MHICTLSFFFVTSNAAGGKIENLESRCSQSAVVIYGSRTSWFDLRGRSCYEQGAFNRKHKTGQDD